eukprot:5459591-Amphidinium_carterae.1
MACSTNFFSCYRLSASTRYNADAGRAVTGAGVEFSIKVAVLLVLMLASRKLQQEPGRKQDASIGTVMPAVA